MAIKNTDLVSQAKEDKSLYFVEDSATPTYFFIHEKGEGSSIDIDLKKEKLRESDRDEVMKLAEKMDKESSKLSLEAESIGIKETK